MMARALPRSRLDNLIPSLVEAQALVALVPATGELDWAAAAAWDVARAAARPGQRRVALVDLWVEEPKLHEVVRLTPTEGIVDAFEYGVSLTKAAHEIDHVFFIAAGAYTTHAGDLFGNPRWKKLHGGVRVEGALLLLYLSAGGPAPPRCPAGCASAGPPRLPRYPNRCLRPGACIPLRCHIRSRTRPTARPAP